MKRCFDLLLASLGLAVTWPLFLAIALLIKLDSAGSVFFRQERVGKDGRPFRIFKFRTMVENAYKLGPRLTQKRDPRVTRVGQVLRWLKLDELPQLLNVVRGDMSFVGPRPEDPHFVRFYSEEQRAVLAVRPGIVGPSQILGRDELEKYPDHVVDTEQYYLRHILPEKLATDLTYVRTAGLFGDLRLIAGGVMATVFGAVKVKFLRFNLKRIMLLAADTVASLMVYHLAYGLKMEWSYTREDVPYLAAVSALILVVRPPLFLYFGLYQRMLRYLGISDFLAIVRAVSIGSVALTAATYMLGFGTHSRLVFMIEWGLLILVLFGTRVASRRWLESRRATGSRRPRKVVIIGADDTGEQIVSAMGGLDGRRYQPIGFLDDDPAKQGVSIHGIKVLGGIAALPVIAAVEPIDMVAIVLTHVSPASLRQIVAYCRTRRIDYRLVPTLDRLLRGDVVLPEFSEPWAPEADPARVIERAGETVSRNGEHAAGVKDNGHPAPAVARNGRSSSCILVTGGAGYVGSHVVRKLLSRGTRVRIVDRYLYGSHGLADVMAHPNLEIIEGDIRDLRTMSMAVKGAHAVIALAAIVGDAACDLDPEETHTINLEATRLLAGECEREGVRRLVFASSCSVYGANSALTLNEGSWLNPVSLYAKTRIQSEAHLLRRADRLSVVILRLATVFGLSRRMRLDLVVNTFAANAFFQGGIRVFGGQQWRPNLHAQDAADAFILAAEADDDKVRSEIFNVGDNDNNLTVLDIAEIVKAELPETKIEVLEESADKRDYRVSFDKIRHVLGFSTKFTVEDGVAEMIQAFRNGEVVVPTLERYHNFRYLKSHGFAEPARRPTLLPTEVHS